MTPRASCAGVSWAMVLKAPRSLKEPMGWADSSLMKMTGRRWDLSGG